MTFSIFSTDQYHFRKLVYSILLHINRIEFRIRLDIIVQTNCFK